jgi:transcriptional regulator GlxA family with amidase domain
MTSLWNCRRKSPGWSQLEQAIRRTLSLRTDNAHSLPRDEKDSRQNSPSALSSPRLRRVIERMHAGLSSEIDLKTLAVESGYSRNHFLKMLREATGYPPPRKASALASKGSSEANEE